MLKKFLCTLLSCSMCLSMLSLPASAEEATTVTLLPNSESPFGEFEGFGTSLCWWANRVGYSNAMTEQAAKLFYNEETGLGLDIARYNIGGGDDPTHNHITRSDSKIPGYSTGYDANGNLIYDWSQDQNQRNVLNAALANNPNLYVEGFSNSPPYFMTNSGCSSGASDASKNNLKDDCYDDFAQYLADVTKHFKDAWGIKFKCISPMNEPNTSYWGAYSAKQEGCHFDAGTSQSNMFVSLNTALVNAGLDDVAIVGSDETSIDTAITSFNALSDDAKNVLDRIDTHTYGGSKRSTLMSTAQAAGKGLWMSEVDGTWKAGTDPYMYAGLGLASRIMTDINGMMPTAWVMWDIIDIHKDSTFSGEENNDFPTTSGFWGVGVADHDKQEIRVSKKYYAYGQFTRYINPGSTIILSSDTTNHLCAYDKHNGRIVIVASNTTANTQKMKYDLNQFVNVGSKVKVIRTSSSENWAQLDDLSTSMKAFSAELAPNSITTFIVEPDTTNKELTLKNRNGYSLNGITITDAGNGNVFLKKGDKYVAVNSDKSISFADTGSRFTMENYNGYYKFKDATTGEYLNVDNRQLLKTGQNFMPPTAPEGSAVFVATYDKSGILTDVKVNPSSPLDIAQNMRCFVWKNDTLSPAAKSEVIEDTSSSLWDVQISSEVSSISISADKSFVYAGNTVNMTCSLLPNTANQSVTWSVKGEDGISETSIASIDPQTGVLATTNAGVVTVIARSNVYDGIYSLYKVTIYGNNTYFTISNKNSGLILQPLNRSSSEGTSYVQWQNLGYATQQFQLKDAGDGFYYIVNRYNGMAILANSSTSTLTQTASYTDNDLAKWSFTIVSGQYGKILNKQTGKAIDVSGQSTVNGGSIIQYAYSGGNNQLWSFSEFVGEPTRTLSVTADNTQVSIGSTLQMNAVFEPDNCETSVQWSVSDTAIAEISDSGLLTGKSSGTVTVTATSTVYAGVSGSIDITVLNAGTSIIKAWTNNFDALDLNGFVCSGTATIATNNNSTPALFVQNKLNNTSSGTGSGTASNTLASALTCGENQYVDIQFDMYCSNSGGTASFQLYSGTTPVINMSTDSWTTNLTLTLGSTAVNTSSVNIGKLLRNSTNTGSSAYNVSNGAHFHIQIDFAKHTIKLNAYNNTSTSTVLSCEGTLPEEITSLDKMVFSANYTSWTKYMIVDNLSTYILSNS